MSTNLQQKATKWDNCQAQYLLILANPLENRTDDEIAKELGIDRSTLWRWRQIDGFVDEAYSMMMKNLQGKLGKVFTGLLKRAQDGDSGSARLILEAIGKLKSGTNVQVNILNMPVTEYTEEMRGKLMEKFQELELSDPGLERKLYERLKSKYDK